MSITVVGIGPGDEKFLTKEAIDAITDSEVYIRTEQHPSVDYLKKLAKKTYFFDYLYETEDTFDQIYTKIADKLLSEGLYRDIVYAVPGNPFIFESSVNELKKRSGDLKVISGLSFIDVCADALGEEFEEDVILSDSFSILEDKFRVNPNLALLISQVYNKHLLSELKLKLSTIYPEETEVFLLKNCGLPNQELIKTKLYLLDREEPNHLSSVFIPAVENQMNQLETLEKLVAYLRSPDGCPWDRKQDFMSLRRNLLEESYEVIDAVEKEDPENLEEELGDLLFSIMLYAQMGKEKNLFDIYSIIEKIANKMVERHQHVFSDVKVDSINELLDNWEKIKEKEKHLKRTSEDMKRIPAALPELLRADKIQSKAKKDGFDWDSADEALEKVEEEVGEVKEAIKSEENLKEELGDLLFATVNVLRLLEMDPEETLKEANKKFITRYEKMEDYAAEKDKNFKELTLAEQEEIWEKIK